MPLTAAALRCPPILRLFRGYATPTALMADIAAAFTLRCCRHMMAMPMMFFAMLRRHCH